MSTVGFFAHAPADGGEGMARDAIALALALMTHDHRLLLHVSPSLAVPLLLAGETARSQLVLEGAERHPHPMIMLPSDRPEGPEAALFARVEIGTTRPENQDRRFEGHTVSLMERFEELGVVDTRWIRAENTNWNLTSILEEESPRAVVAMGWTEAMEGVVAAAEAYADRSDAPLLVAGPRQGPMAESKRWRDVEIFADFSPPDLQPFAGEDSHVSEGFYVAWKEAIQRARITLAAEALAMRLVK